MRYRLMLASGCIAGVLIMAGCTDAEPADGTPTPTSPTTAYAPPGTATETEPPASPTTGSTATAPPAGNRPADLATVSQGGSYWAVYLVVAPAGDPRLDAVHHELESAGYHPTIGELGCDRGAAEQLTPPPDPNAHAVRVYFGTESDAQQFAAGTSPAPVATAFVQAFCQD